MAAQDSENPSSSGARLSPGDAAFERLRQREALKSRDEPARTPETDAAMFIGPPVNPAIAAAAARPAEGGHDAAPDRILAMAAAFGIEPATPAAVEEAPVAIDAPAARWEAAETPDPVPGAAAPEVAPIEIAPAESPPPEVRRRQPSVDPTAERLEAALLDQLRSLEETLVEDAPRAPPRLPRAAPLRTAIRATTPTAPDGPPERSVFAPDPVRQRTYVDLRAPSPVTENSVSDDPPWRKYLDEMPRPEPLGRSRPHRRADTPGRRPAPMAAAAHDRNAEGEERGRGIRAMSAAAVLGLGVGLGVLVLLRPFVDAGAPAVASLSGPFAPAPATGNDAATMQAVANPVNQALATLLADPPISRSSPGRPAVISEPGTSPDAPVAGAPPEVAEPIAVPAPPVIRPPPGEAVAVARAPDFEAAESGPLAYGPAIPSYDPVRQQLLEQEAAETAADEPRTQAARAPVEAAPEPAAVARGRAVINDFVNLRAKPDNAAPVVAILAEGLAIKVIACDYWCEIEAGGKRGFVYKKFVSR